MNNNAKISPHVGPLIFRALYTNKEVKKQTINSTAMCHAKGKKKKKS